MNRERTGELLQFSGTFLWAIYPIITVLTYGRLPSLIALGWVTLFASLFFLALVGVRNRWKELLNPILWRYILGVVIFIGILFYGLSFVGLSMTTPGNASIIALFQVFAGFVFFNLFKKEFFSRDQIFGSILVIIGAIIVLIPGYSGNHIGDLLILLAASISPFGDYCQKKARAVASSESAMFLRSIITAPIIFGIAALLHMHANSSDVIHSLPFLLINGVILFGVSKIFWLEAIHRISVTKAYALASIGPLFTLLFAWLILHQIPTVWQLLSFIPFFFGILLLTRRQRIA